MKPSFDDLKSKIAVITGGAGIIGSCMAESLALLGTKIVILDRDENKAVQLAKRITQMTSSLCIGVGADVLDKASLEQALLKIHDSVGKIDILIIHFQCLVAIGDTGKKPLTVNACRDASIKIGPDIKSGLIDFVDPIIKGLEGRTNCNSSRHK